MDIDRLEGKSREDVLADIANQYYNLGRNQSEIAKQYDTNRFKIAKLIQEARDEQIVEIRIHSSEETSQSLEQELMNAFPLQKAIVVNTQYAAYIDSLRQLGEVGAKYVQQLLIDDAVLGITWGKTIHSVLSQLPAVTHKSITTLQLTGNFKQSNPAIDSRSLVPMTAAACSGAYYYMDAPIYVKDTALKAALMAEPGISQTLRIARNMTTIITGIGGKSSIPITNPVFAPYITPEDQQVEPHCIGSIYGYVMDDEGKIADIPLNSKLIATPMEDILRAEHRLGVLYGRHKAQVTARILQNGWVNELLTDTDTARRLLQYAQ